MRVGLIGTGAIAHKHAQAYGELGYKLAAAANRNADKGRAYAAYCRPTATLNGIVRRATTIVVVRGHGKSRAAAR